MISKISKNYPRNYKSISELDYRVILLQTVARCRCISLNFVNFSGPLCICGANSLPA